MPVVFKVELVYQTMVGSEDVREAIDEAYKRLKEAIERYDDPMDIFKVYVKRDIM